MLSAPSANATRAQNAHPARWNSRTAWIVLVVGLMMTAAVTWSMKASVDRTAEQEFTSRCAAMQNRIKDRLDDYARVLQGGVALFSASDLVTREEWRVFTQAQKIEKHLPGIQGIGFSLLIPREGLTRHVKEIRREGFPEYTLKPGGDREVYSSIIYLEPFSGRNLRAFGYDMFSEPVRRAAMEQARDTGVAALSGKVVLVQETDTEVQAGTLMYLPVYRKGVPIETTEQRRAAIYGWVYSPYRMNDLMQGTFGDRNSKNKKELYLQVFDGTQPSPQNMLYESRAAGDQLLRSDPHFTRQIPVDFNGRRWTLRFIQTGDGFLTVDYARVWLTMVGGTLITLLLFALIHTLLSTSVKAERMAGELTVELRAITDRLTLATEAGGVGIWDYDVVNNRLIWDDQMFDLYGVTRDHFGGAYEAWQAGLHPEDRQRGDEEIQLALQGKRDFNTEFRVVWSDGNIRNIRALAIVRRDVSGQPLRMIGTNWDITKYKRAEESLWESRQRFQGLVETLYDWVWETDYQGRYSYVSPRVKDILGYESEELLGKTPFDVMSTEEAQRVLRIFEPLAAEQKPIIALENTCLHKDGHPVILETSALPFYDAKGDYNGYHGTDRDITARKQMEAELVKAKNLESIGTLAGGIAHDFNNLLMAVVGNIDLAKMDISPEDEAYKFLEEAEQASFAAKELAQRLTTFSKGRFSMKEIMGLNQLVEDTAAMVLSDSGIQFEYSLSDSLFPVVADDAQIRQVMRNLILNSKEAMPEGGTIRISTANTILASGNATILPAGDYIEMTMQDQGAGIKEEDLPKIFDPYFTTKGYGAEKGSGLGLAEVYSIIRGHDGYIGVESVPGKGTTVHIYLPAYKEEVKEGRHQTETSEYSKSKILFMDDEKPIRDMASKLITRLGYEVVVTGNGSETIALYKAALSSDKPYNGVILDLTMKHGLGGKETLNRLISIDPNVKAVISSGYADDPVISNYIDYGFKGAITKPYKVDELKKLLQRVIPNPTIDLP